MNDGSLTPFGDAVKQSPKFFQYFLQPPNDGKDRWIGWVSAGVGRTGRDLTLAAEDVDIGQIGGALNYRSGRGFDSRGHNWYEGSTLFMQAFSEGGGAPKFGLIGTSGTTWNSGNSVGGLIPAFWNVQYIQYNVAPGNGAVLGFDGTTIFFNFGPDGLGFNGASRHAKPTITGSRGGNAALASLLTALALYGLITDGTSA